MNLIKVGKAALAAVVTISMSLPSTTAWAAAAITQIPGTERTEKSLDGSFLSVTGFAKDKVNDRSQYKEGDSEYAVVNNAYEYFQALEDASSGIVKVIEIRCDLNLGWNELSDEVKEEFGNLVEPYQSSLSISVTPVGNPILIETGISCVTINDVDGLTIFSKEGNAIRHVETKFNSEANDIIIRNLCFEETWEWDDWRSSGFGSSGGHGNHKRSGWTNIKLNGCSNVWLDHCSFGISFDGNVDIENGATGISLTWCEVGNEDTSPGSMLYETVQYLEQIYQQSKEEGSNIKSFVMYGIMRDNGMTTDQIIKYMVYHSKCHLVGSGDKDSWLVPVLDQNGNYQFDEDGKLITEADKTKENANEKLRLTLAYNYYRNMGSRVPMIRSGVAHLYNCYLNDMDVAESSSIIHSKPEGQTSTIRAQIEAAGGGIGALMRGMDARNGASAAADTCVYYGVADPIIGAESQLKGGGNNVGYEKYWKWNYNLIVNSTSFKRGDSIEYVGSSWDNNGVNPFASAYSWDNKSTINNWSWGQEGDKLSYTYQTFPLADVKTNITTYSGAYKLDMEAKDWLRTEYDSSFSIKQLSSGDIPIESISFQTQEATVFTDEYLQLIDRAMPLNHTEKIADYTWESSNPKAAKVLDSGLLVPVAKGDTTITVTTKGGKTASCLVHIAEKPTDIDMSQVPDVMYVGDIIQFHAYALPSDLLNRSVTWSSMGNKISFLDEEAGLAQAEITGSNNIVASATLIGNRIGDVAKTARKKITVEEPAVAVTGVTISDTTANILAGASKQLTGAVEPLDATNQKVVWSSSDETVATVDDNGLVTGLKDGEAVITITSINYGFTKTCTVTVTDTERTRGDIDGNGTVDAADAYEVLASILGKRELTQNQINAADYNEDKEIDVVDVLDILKFAVGK